MHIIPGDHRDNAPDVWTAKRLCAFPFEDDVAGQQLHRIVFSAVQVSTRRICEFFSGFGYSPFRWRINALPNATNASRSSGLCAPLRWVVNFTSSFKSVRKDNAYN